MKTETPVKLKSFGDLVDLWPTQLALADDLSTDEKRIVSTVVALWKHRNICPAKYWVAIVLAAEERGIKGVTLERLAQIEAGRH